MEWLGERSLLESFKSTLCHLGTVIADLDFRFYTFGSGIRAVIVEFGVADELFRARRTKKTEPAPDSVCFVLTRGDSLPQEILQQRLNRPL